MTTKRSATDLEAIGISIGCDPELFVYDTKAKRYISPHEFIPGTKDKPHQLRVGTVQLDGLAVEFGIAPSYTPRDFTRNIEGTLSCVKELLPEGMELHAVSSVWFDKDYFDKEMPESSKVLGCEPDFNANKDGEINPRPDGMIVKDNKVLRTGAGHIHIGWGQDFDVGDEQHLMNCILLTKKLDSLFKIAEPAWDTDTTRREMYGALGSFRPKPYGMEYRVPSNAWLKSTALRKYVYDLVYFAVQTLYVGLDSGYIKYNVYGDYDWDKTLNMYKIRTIPLKSATELYNARMTWQHAAGNPTIISPYYSEYITNSAYKIVV